MVPSHLAHTRHKPAASSRTSARSATPHGLHVREAAAEQPKTPLALAFPRRAIARCTLVSPFDSKQNHVA
eukprot:6867807-Prymnesium_polylepis.2